MHLQELKPLKKVCRVCKLAIIAISAIAIIEGCSPYMYGYTSSKALNHFSKVGVAENSFGYKRLKYNQGYHPKSELATFIGTNNYPDFIYEDVVTDKGKKLNHTILFYVSRDSAFEFTEKKKCWCSPIQTSGRKITDAEKAAFAFALK